MVCCGFGEQWEADMLRFEESCMLGSFDVLAKALFLVWVLYLAASFD